MDTDAGRILTAQLTWDRPLAREKSGRPTWVEDRHLINGRNPHSAAALADRLLALLPEPFVSGRLIRAISVEGRGGLG